MNKFTLAVILFAVICGVIIMTGDFGLNKPDVVVWSEVATISDDSIDEMVKMYCDQGECISEEKVNEMKQKSREALINVLESKGYKVE